MNPSKYLGNELKYIERVLNAESWSATGGSWNHALEQKFADKFGVKYAIAMNSGTATLHAALAAGGVGDGDEVISPAFTVIMDATATLHARGVPVFADVKPDTFNVDTEDIERKITPRTQAIIAVGMYGLNPDMDAIMEIANKHGILVIEDNAQAFNPEYKLRGHFASYSFETTKHISCGEGGMLVTNDKGLAEKARKIAGHGYKNLLADEGRVMSNSDVFQRPDYKRHDTVGWNYRMPEFNAAIALAQLERADELVNMRKKAAEHFKNAMAFCDYLVPQKGEPNSFYTLGAVYNGPVPWEEFRKMYIANGGDGIYSAWSIPYQEPALSFLSGNCPVAESIQPKMMQFKTNYRDEELAIKKAEALYKTIMHYKRVAAGGKEFEL